MSTKFTAVITVLLTGASLVASTATAEVSTNASGVSPDELIPSMSSGQAYSERYNFAVDLDNGGHISMNWTISNLGIRNGYGAAEVEVRHSDIDDYHSSERESRRNWSYDENRFALDIADASIEAVDDGIFDLRYTGDDVRIELRFDNTIDAWRPPDGEVDDNGDFYRFTMVAPRADVTGRVYIEGQWHDVSGDRSGYADHVVTNIAPYNLATRFSRFRQYDDDVFVMWREMALTDDYGGDSNAWIVVGVGDELVYEDTAPDVRFGDIDYDAETGYHVPHAIQILSNNGDGQLQLTLREDEIHRTDLLDHYGRVVRMIASTVSEPYQYDIHGDYALQFDVGDHLIRTIESGHVTIDYINPD